MRCGQNGARVKIVADTNARFGFSLGRRAREICLGGVHRTRPIVHQRGVAFGAGRNFAAAKICRPIFVARPDARRHFQPIPRRQRQNCPRKNYPAEKFARRGRCSCAGLRRRRRGRCNCHRRSGFARLEIISWNSNNDGGGNFAAVEVNVVPKKMVNLIVG